MSHLRVHSFLGEASRPHFTAVSQLVAAAVGLAPAEIDEPGLDRLDEVLATPGPALLFLCGLPYVRARDRGVAVEPIGAAVPFGETLPRYFSELVAPAGSDAAVAEDLVGRRIGFNGRDSLSGYVLPFWALIARGLGHALYDDAIATGSHRRSLDMLIAGELDAAAIDSTLLALQRSVDPRLAGLRVVERLGPAPIPPVVLLHGDPALAAALGAALRGLAGTDAGREALALGQVERYAAVGDADYDAVRSMDGSVR